MEFFYHIKPEKLKGNLLKPLNELNSSEEKEKYKDRKELLKKEIKILDASWDDVVFFSTLDSKIIFLALELLGLYDNNKIKYYKFPISCLKNKEACLYNEGLKQEFKKLDISSYKETKFIPEKTIKYFVECVKTKEDPLIFYGVEHILLKDELDINKAKELVYIPSLN